MRQEKSKHLLEDFQKFIDEESPNVLPKSTLGKALDFIKKLLSAINYVLEDGELEIDNNSAERAIKLFVIGMVYLMDFMNNTDIKDKNCLADAITWSNKISDDLKH